MSFLSNLFGSRRASGTQSQQSERPAQDDLSSEALVSLRNDRITNGKRLKYEWQRDTYEPCPPKAKNPFPQMVGQIPEIAAADLNLDVLSGAIGHHGALIVRGLMDNRESAELRKDIDHVIDSDVNDEPSVDEQAWFSVPKDVKMKQKEVIFAKECNAIFTFMSPRVSNKLLGYFDRISLRAILKGYFNEEPCVSFKKSVLRRVEPKSNVSEWHQDGAFMTEEIASLNVWIALTECGPGTGAPGMKFVPKRLENVIDATGKNGAAVHWSVSQKTIDEQFTGDLAEVSPYFNEGDAIFFDHLNLHATATGAEFTKKRYAIETWFFASSRHAENQISVAWT